jgi:hypothetical protein
MHFNCFDKVWRQNYNTHFSNQVITDHSRVIKILVIFSDIRAVSSTIINALWKSSDLLKTGSSVTDFGEILIEGCGKLARV